MASPRNYSKSDLDLIEQGLQMQARRSFWAYRQYIHPSIIRGWWQREVAAELTRFYHDFRAGLRPILLIQAPPQHGKSVQIVDFVSWLTGHMPDTRTIYTSFSERLGMRANLGLQRIYDSPKYKGTFDTRIPERSAVSISASRLRNREIIEFTNGEGYFRNTTVRGPVTGEGLSLGIMDDPIKGREEANSPTVRDKTWDWFTDDFLSRFSDDAGLLGIMTRWHIDDPFGRIEKTMPRARVLRYPAIATHDEPHRKAGEPLFPEHKSLDFLLERKSAMHPANWSALYQQDPYIAGGDMFHDAWWRYYRTPPRITHRVIYADTAQKVKTQNDYSVFACWGKAADGQAVLLDLLRGKWEAPELLANARAFWHKHAAQPGMGKLRAMKVEDKVSGTGLIQTLRREGIPVIAVQRDTDKISRAMDVSPSVEAGLCLLPDSAPWLSDFIQEHGQFPNGKFDDMVDTTIDAIADLIMPAVGKRAGVW